MTSRRPYLAADARHEDLLEAAGRLFERGGMSAVTMVALAKEAGVSRALVYQHFTDIGSLVVDFFEDRADKFFARAHRDDADELTPLVNAFRELVGLPDLELRGMDMLLSDYPEPDLEPIRDRLRERFVERWAASFDPPREPVATRAAVWAVIQATLSLAVAVKRGELEESIALPMWLGMVGAVAQHLPVASPRPHGTLHG